MKKTLSSLLIVVFMLTLVLNIPMNSLAATEYTSGDYTYTLSDNKATIVEASASLSGDVYIPSKLDGYTVVEIGYEAFYKCELISNVVIPDTVKKISYGAFGRCISLVSVTFGNGVTSIGGSAFSNCSALRSIEIPDNVTSLSDSAFSNCTRLTDAKIGKNVKSISASCFSGCERLKNVTINGNNLTSIDSRAFDGCTKLVDMNWSGDPVGSATDCIRIPDSVTKLDSWAFSECSAITKLICGANTETIGYQAFYKCSLLADCSFNEKLTSISSEAFLQCIALTNIVIPDSVTSISGSAFSKCTALKSVQLGNGLKKLGDAVFSGCTALKSVFMGDNITNTGGNTFYNCSSLTEIRWSPSLQTIGSRAFEECTALKNLVIPDNVTTIDSWAFTECSGLERVVFGKNLVNVNYEAFYNCNNLKSIIFADRLINIKTNAFKNCSSLNTIVLSGSLQSVSSSAFYKCGITDVYYDGSKEDWEDFVEVDTGNDPLLNATFHYNCDTTKPTGAIIADQNAQLGSSYTVTIMFSDNVGVKGYYWGTNSDFKQNQFTSTAAGSVKKTITEAGTYYLVVEDVNGIYSTCYSITFYNVSLNANGGNCSLTKFLAERGKDVTPPSPSTNQSELVFKGWATSQTSISGSKSISPTSETTYYAIWGEAETEVGLLGDINSDGNINQYDYILAKRIHFKNYTPNAEEIARGDVNNDGKNDQYDYILIKRHHFKNFTITGNAVIKQ